MHVAVDLNWFVQIVVLVSAAVLGLLYLVRNTASRYFVVDSNFDSSAADYSSLDPRKGEQMAAAGGAAAECSESCAVCGLLTKKQCARCKMVKYCSADCQKSHWDSGHKTKCKELQSLYKANHLKTTTSSRERKAPIVPVGGSSKILKHSNKILFPYEEFIELFNWNKPGYPPCGLLNCGNSCFANVVLQCLSYTRPLVSYLLEKGHRIECQRDDWCFFCEFQTHVERTSRSPVPFSPLNILSRLPNIGGNLGYGKQEDAHEFMRFAIDTMQSVCLEEFGGEKAVHPMYQETTLIQHIFGGRLQSQVICTECNNVSNQFENMMDLTVEIHGDAGSLEECLDQFTAKEWLHGDNMYKCDGCNAYVMAWKRLTVQRAPNILTIALKRFQSGRFGKLNKRVTFPETLDLGPYMNELEDGNDIYKLYAVIVHVDMLNASFFGHYICYVKDFRGNWYRIDDYKVTIVDLDEVLLQGAYMLLYSRISARPSCLLSESARNEQKGNAKIQLDSSLEQPAECLSVSECNPEQSTSINSSMLQVDHEEVLLPIPYADAKPSIKLVSFEPNLPVAEDAELHEGEEPRVIPLRVTAQVEHTELSNPSNAPLLHEVSRLPGVQSHEPSSPVLYSEDVDGLNQSVADEGLLENLTGKSTAAENCFFENGETTSDVSASSVTVEAPNGLNSESPMLENGASSHAAVKKSNEESLVKLKPVFSPGFLGKRPRRNCLKSENKQSVELGESIPKNHINQTKEDIKPCLSRENGSFLKHGFLNDDFSNDDTKPTVLHGKGKASVSFDACKSMENEDAGHNRVSCAGTKSGIANGKLPVGQQIPFFDNESRG